MATIATRLKKLENRNLPYIPKYTVIHRQFVKPSPEAPIPCGGRYHVYGGGTFYSEDYESEEKLLDAVNTEHVRVHGSQMPISN